MKRGKFGWALSWVCRSGAGNKSDRMELIWKCGKKGRIGILGKVRG